jgi:hypothetical protein
MIGLLPSATTVAKFCHKKVLRTFRSKRDKVPGEWRKLHYKELHNLYFFLNVCEIGGTCRTQGI